jgi:hypothetical protein
LEKKKVSSVYRNTNPGPLSPWPACYNNYAVPATVYKEATIILLLLLPLALQPAVGFGLSKNTSPFFPIHHQLSPSSHSQQLKTSFCFFSLSFPGSSSACQPFQFSSENLFGHPILLHSLQVTQSTYALPLYSFYYIFSFTHLF